MNRGKYAEAVLRVPSEIAENSTNWKYALVNGVRVWDVKKAKKSDGGGLDVTLHVRKDRARAEMDEFANYVLDGIAAAAEERVLETETLAEVHVPETETETILETTPETTEVEETTVD